MGQQDDLYHWATHYSGGGGGGGGGSPAAFAFPTASGTLPLTQQGTTTSTTMPITPTGPYPNRALPSWMPGSADAGMGELLRLFGDKSAFDTTAYDKASEESQARILSQGLSAANASAEEYVNRTRQQGGNAAISGVVKAQGVVGAQTAAGQLKLEQQKYDQQQREAAATHSAQIATTIAGLRDSYLKSLIGYTTSEDASQTGRTTTGTESTFGGGPAGGGGGGRPPASSTPINFSHGYVPSFGPITPASFGGVTVPNSVYGAWPTSWGGG